MDPRLILAIVCLAAFVVALIAMCVFLFRTDAGSDLGGSADAMNVDDASPHSGGR